MQPMFLPRLLLLLIASSLAALASGQELLRNGDFQDWPEEQLVPRFWTLDQAQTLKPGEFSRAPAGAGEDRRAVQFHDALQVHSLSQTVPVKGGTAYDLSCRAKVKLAPWFFALALQWRDGGGRAVGKFHMKLATGWDADFKTLALAALEAPPEARQATVLLIPYGVNERNRVVEGTILATDVSLRAAVAGAEPGGHTTEAAIPLLPEAKIVIDGAADEPVWQQAMTLGNFSTPGNGMLAAAATEARVCADAANLYVWARLEGAAPESLQNLDKTPRDKMAMQGEIFELFCQPDRTSREQFHVLVNPAGAVMDSREVWRGEPTAQSAYLVDIDNSWDGLAESATTVQAGSWTVELRLPLRALGVTGPLAGARWRANLARAAYSSQQFSSWSRLSKPVFQDTREWGSWHFLRGPAVLSGLTLAPVDGKPQLTMQLANPAAQAQAVAAVLEEEKDGQRHLLSRQALTLAPGAAGQTIRFDVPTAGNLLWVSLAAGSERLYCQALRPATKFVELSWYDPERVLDDTLWLASDLGSFKPFYTRHNFKPNLGGLDYLSRASLPVDLVFELPEGVAATSVELRPWSGTRFTATPASKGRSFPRAGTVYTEYIFALPAVAGKDDHSLTVFFTTTLAAGTRGKAYAYARWPDGRQAPRELSIEVFELGTIKPFVRTSSRWDFLDAEFVNQWLPHPEQQLRAIGINTFPVPLNPARERYQGSTQTRESAYATLLPKLQAASCYLMLQNDVLPQWYRWTAGKDPDPAAIARDREGRPVINAYASATFCQLYRGRHYRAWMDEVRQSAALRQYGVTWAVLDFEFWPAAMVDDGCYCEHCLAEFARWCPANGYPQVTASPKEFMATPAASPEAVAAWKAFSRWRFRSLFADVKQELAATVGTAPQWTGPQPRFLVSEWRRPVDYLLGTVDYFDLNLYFAPALVESRISEMLAAQGPEFKSFVAALAPAPTWLQNTKVRPEENVYSIYEAAVGKTQGFEWFMTATFDMKNVKAMVDGYRAISPFEDIYLDGRVEPQVPCRGGAASARAIVRGEEALLLVRDYDLKAAATASVTIPGQQAAELFDTASGERLGAVTPANRELNVPLEPAHRARLLYLGSAARFAARRQP